MTTKNRRTILALLIANLVFAVQNLVLFVCLDRIQIFSTDLRRLVEDFARIVRLFVDSFS